MDQTPDRANPVEPTNDATPPAKAEEAPPAPLTPMGWLMQNGIYLITFAVLIGVIIKYLGLDGLWQVALAVAGLGLIIFIHELGHFVAAKWCDVHVQTFSLGFGPAIPGCSFRRGETLYKIAILPLGGYVAMVGEGAEAEEDDNYPRSFKNKTVGQRMIIISAGVVMNMILGCLCFVGVFYFHGALRPRGVVSSVEPASPAWTNEVRSNSRITNIDGKQNPNFHDLLLRVSSRFYHGKVHVELQPHADNGSPLSLDLEPRRNANDDLPIIGVGFPYKLQLPSVKMSKEHDSPVVFGSPASKAHAENLPAGETDGFHFGDKIVGMTDAAQVGEYNAAAVKPLPLDPFDDKQENYDVYEFQKRLRMLAGKKIVIQVQRENKDKDKITVNLEVPPAYTPTTGMVMEMGHVAGVRNNSPAARAKLQLGDTITKIELSGGEAAGTAKVFDDFDPARLPLDLAQAANKIPGKVMARITVQRTPANAQESPEQDKHKGANAVTLDPVEWDASWDDNIEWPLKPASPLSIPQLGVAYWIDCRVKKVISGSAAEKAGIKEGDRIESLRWRTAGKTPSDPENWSSWVKMESIHDNGRTEYNTWAWVCGNPTPFGYLDPPKFQVTVVRGDKTIKGADGKDQEFDLETTPDLTWPSTNLGFNFLVDTTLVKATSILDALGLGLNETWDLVQHFYLSMRNLVAGRNNPIKGFSGPIGIATMAYSAAEDLFTFVLFMGMISINLAVVNFLPIPLLDGGHMVFLIYEWIRGKPPSDRWKIGLSIAGGVALILLMVAAALIDIYKLL